MFEMNQPQIYREHISNMDGWEARSCAIIKCSCLNACKNVLKIYMIFVNMGEQSSYHSQTDMSIRSTIWGISAHDRHKHDVLYYSSVYNKSKDL